MDLLRRMQLFSALVLCATLSVGCEEPEFDSGPEGEGQGSTPGGGAPPSFGLPDGGAALPPSAGTSLAPGQCAGEVYKAEIVPLDLMLLMDSSASMLEVVAADGYSKWETAQAALGAFINDPESRGLGVGLHFFPTITEKTCNTDGDCVAGSMNAGYCAPKTVCAGLNATPGRVCNPATAGACPRGQQCVLAGSCSTTGGLCTNIGGSCPQLGSTCGALPAKVCRLVYPSTECEEVNYQEPSVRIGVLPTGQAQLLQSLNRKLPEGGTPLGPAVRGVLTHLRAHLNANPDRRAVLVVTSDGLPSGCSQNQILEIANILQTAYTRPPYIPTYVIAVLTPEDLKPPSFAQGELDKLAYGGGSSRAIVLSAASDLTQRLQDALNQIRVAALPCEYRIPAPSGRQIDLGKVNMRYSDGATEETVPYVALPDRCDPVKGGWYYDVAPGAGQPARVLTCAATCRVFKANPAAKVDLIYGCATQTID
jgi:hypothetical protein